MYSPYPFPGWLATVAYCNSHGYCSCVLPQSARRNGMIFRHSTIPWLVMFFNAHLTPYTCSEAATICPPCTIVPNRIHVASYQNPSAHMTVLGLVVVPSGLINQFIF